MNKTPTSEKEKQKLRGGYYTPLKITDFLTNWALKKYDDSKNILEPSMGDGNFIISISKALLEKGVTKNRIGSNVYGVELFPEEIRKAKKRLVDNGYNIKNYSLLAGDYFHINQKRLGKKKFDIILGNPPFIRYQNFPIKQRTTALLYLNSLGFHPNKLTNAWLFFLLASVISLKDQGRIAMVVPAELLQVKYASETRKFLSNYLSKITIISFKKLVFDNIQQEVVLFLGEKNGDYRDKIDLVEVESERELGQYYNKIESPKHFKPINHDTDKWTQYFLSKSEILLLKKTSKNKKILRMRDLMNVDVGIVTGKNEFFCVDDDTVNKYNLREFIKPLVGRTSHLNGGAIFRKSDWSKIKIDGNKSYLFSYDNPVSAKTPPGVKKYIKYGERNNFHTGYKCRIRKIWHSIPSIWTPDAFLFRQIHDYPKLVLNSSKTLSTDTIHRVRINKEYDRKLVIGSFFNSLTFAFSEIYGRSYGGGVLELEPNEAEDLPTPLFSTSEVNLNLIDDLLRKKQIFDVLDYVDNILLKKELHLSAKEINALRGIWLKLSKRRHNRR